MKRIEKMALGGLVITILTIVGFAIFLAFANQRLRAARSQYNAQDAVSRPPTSADVVDSKRAAAPSAAKPANADWTFLSGDPVKDFSRLLELLEELAADHEVEFGELSRSPAQWLPEDLDRLRTLVKEMEPLFNKIRAVAAQGGPTYPLDFSRGYSMELPHLARVRWMAQLLRGDAYVAMKDGDTRRVLDNIAAIEQLGEALSNEPILISQNARHGISGIAFETIGHSLPANISRDDAARVIEELSQYDYRDRFAGAYRGEGAMGEMFLEDPDWDLLSQDPSITGASGNLGHWLQRGLMRLYETPLGSPFVTLDEAAYLDILVHVQAAANLPYYEAIVEARQIQDRIDDLSVMRIFTRQMLPANTRVYQAQARHEAMLDLAQLGIAVEQFRQEMGVYPQSLDDVARDIPGGLPIDPLSGLAYVGSRAIPFFSTASGSTKPTTAAPHSGVPWTATSSGAAKKRVLSACRPTSNPCAFDGVNLAAKTRTLKSSLSEH